MDFLLFMIFLLVLRFTELYLSRKNEKWLRKKGAVEYGAKHYPLIVMIHTLFLLSLVVEYFIRNTPSISFIYLLPLLLLLLLKVWVIASLGRYWNTKIFRIPHFSPIKKGPYRYLKHPNYIIVVGEILLIPLSFHLYFTAILFTLLNAFALQVRIRKENQVWSK